MSDLTNWADCGGTVMASGNCSCEVEHCAACGATYHTDAGALRYCSAWGQICADNPDCRVVCDTGECCMPPECFDNRDR
jgi:hypothetical protein